VIIEYPFLKEFSPYHIRVEQQNQWEEQLGEELFSEKWLGKNR